MFLSMTLDTKGSEEIVSFFPSDKLGKNCMSACSHYRIFLLFFRGGGGGGRDRIVEKGHFFSRHMWTHD